MEPSTPGAMQRLAPAVVTLGVLAVAGTVIRRQTSGTSIATGGASRWTEDLFEIPRDEADALGLISPNSEDRAYEENSSKKPHIVLFTVDDMGWNDIGYISTDISQATPHMTALAAKGIKLTHYYTQPSCSPSRVAMMTGKFPYKNGLQNYEIQVTDEIGVPLSNKLMPAYMKELGYRTVMYGKWNIGHCNTRYLPHERGFDHFVGYMCPGHGYSDYACGLNAGVRDMLQGEAKPSSSSVAGDGATSAANMTYNWTTGEEYLGIYDTTLYRDKTVESIRKHAALYASDVNSSPLFIWAAQHGMHSEFDSGPNPPDDILTADNQDFMKVLKKRLETAAGEEQLRFFKMRLLTASVLMAVDNSLKAVVDALEDEGMLANTVLFVNSDNGGHPVYTQGHPGNNYPLRSSKFAYYEGGVRVPAFVFAPGHIPSARKGTAYHGLMHHVDLLTTFYSLGGGDVATLKSSAVGSDLDGEDHWPALLGGTTSPRNELVLNLPRSTTWKLGENKTDEGVALRVGKYKMLLNHPYDYWFSPNPGEDHNEASSMMASQCMYSWYTVETDSHTCNMTNFLFDVHADPQELTNLWGDSSYDAIRSSLIKRAETLVGTVELDYGRIMYQKNRVDTSASDTAWKAHNWFAVPWQCAVIE